MAWNDLTREQMEAQLLRQAQTIGALREALKPFADEVTVTPEGKYSVHTGRKRSPVTDLLRARRVFDTA